MGQDVKGLFNNYFNQGYTLFHSLETYFSLSLKSISFCTYFHKRLQYNLIAVINTNSRNIYKIYQITYRKLNSLLSPLWKLIPIITFSKILPSVSFHKCIIKSLACSHLIVSCTNSKIDNRINSYIYKLW